MNRLGLEGEPAPQPRLNVGLSPTVGAVFSAMKAEYVVVAEQAHPLGPAYSLPNYFYPAAYKVIDLFQSPQHTL